MKMKNIIALTLAILMLATCMIGCVQTPDDPSSEVEFNVGSLPIVNEPVTLKVLCQDTSDKQYSLAKDAGYWKWLSEKTGITFEIESYSKEELANKLPLIMADPTQMPDLFIACNLTETSVVNYAQGGQLLKLNDLIDQYGTNIKKMFADYPTALGASVLADGSIYAMPAMNGSPSYVMYAVNERFLKNSGINEFPTTLEELAADLKVMREKDANGNGIVGDEILWSCEPKQFKRQALSMVGISCYWPWQGVIVDDRDGEVFFVPTSEEYKYLLTVLRDLWNAGCIDSEIFTQDYAQHVAKFDKDLVFMGEYTDDPETSGYKGMSGWTYMDPVTSAVHDEPIYVVGSDYQVAIGAVSAFTKYPEICALVLDYMYSYDASVTSKWGIEGVDFTVVKEDPWTIQSISPDIPLGYAYTPYLAPRLTTADMIQPQNTALKQIRVDKRDKYGDFGWQNYLHLTTDQADKLGVLSTDLGLFCDDYWAGFITGTYSIEEDWDEYVAECNKMKVNEIVAVYQDAYDVFFGK